MSRWTHGLNPEQRAAVLHDYGAMLILAGAGSGKTTVLVARAGRLIEQSVCEADRLCVLTFTNKAARELKSRVATKLGKRGSGIWAGTFHSFGLYLLRRFAQACGVSPEVGVIDETDAADLAKELMAGFKQSGKTAYDSRRLLEVMSQWRAQGISSARNDDEYEVAAEWLLPRYLRGLERLGVVDFDALLQRPLAIMQEQPKVCQKIRALFDQVMVDEFQDTNDVQMQLVRLISGEHKNLCVVGDDDQAIYGWRGACVRNILDFPARVSDCKIVRLETNYRSTPAILDLANAVISENRERHAKVLRAFKPLTAVLPELIVYGDESEEAEGVCSEVSRSLMEGTAPCEIAVLYRSNSVGASLEAELRKNKIAYAITGGTAFFDRKEPRDILAYLRVAFRPTDLAFRRVLGAPPRGVGEVSLRALEKLSQSRDISLVRSAQQWRAGGLEARVGNGLDELFGELERFRKSVAEAPRLALITLLTRVGYKRHLEAQCRDAIAVTKRWRMVEIFADLFERSLLRGDSVVEFIDAMALRDAQQDEADQGKVQLMTLHASKGLEFECVILVGVEEDMLPHRTLGSDISEERRLFYVGITRAKRRLILTQNQKRNRFGKVVAVVPSRFLGQVPKQLYEVKTGLRSMATDKRKALLSELYERLS